MQVLWRGDSAGRGQQAAGCSLGCWALAPARAAAADDDAEEEESRVRRRRMLAVMLLPWLLNSVAAAALLSATAAPEPRSPRHPSRPNSSRYTDTGINISPQSPCWGTAMVRRTEVTPWCGARSQGKHMERRIRNVCILYLWLKSSLPYKGQTAASRKEAWVPFFGGALHFYKESN